MKLSFKPSWRQAPLIALVVQKGKRLEWADKSSRFSDLILRRAEEDGFTGAEGETFALRPQANIPAARVILASAGPSEESSLHSLRRSAAAAAHWAQRAKPGSLAVSLPGRWQSHAREAQAFAEGFLLGSYKFLKHKTKAEPLFTPREIIFIGPPAAQRAIEEALKMAEIFASSANFARDLTNEPPSLKTPETLGKIARTLGGKGVGVRVYGKTDLKRLGMNAILGVNRGSAHPPVLVHFHYKPRAKARRSLALVGKGITFDSGGLSLKTADGMMTMKYDMAGSAIVFAVFKALRELQPAVEVHGVAAITENMPGHDAYKPGDVLRAMNGKTIEVLNTDAEGRIILSDALSFAARLKVGHIIDMATLTGAATIALGRAYAALMSNNDPLAADMEKASHLSGEKLWRLPLEASYKSHIKSKVADLKNIGNPGEAGTIIGGLFLEEFVENVPWAHLDMAACGWSADGAPWGQAGSTGTLVRTLLHHILA